MDRHGTEQYFVIGEGLFSDADGDGTAHLAAAAAAAAPPFRFSRMGPRGEQLGHAKRVKLARAMIRGGGGNTGIPAGYTYLGQFIDHDLTFDKTKVTLGDQRLAGRPAPGPFAGARPRLAVRRGPGDPESAEFYGRRPPPQDRARRCGPAATRRATGSTSRASAPARGKQAQGAHPRPAQRREPRGRADPRRVHPLPQPGRRHAARRRCRPAQRFAHGARERRQALPVDAAHRLPAADLRRRRWSTTCSPTGARRSRSGADPTDVPTMPIEFRVAAFRLGHSMVREDYNWNARFPDDGAARWTSCSSSAATSGDLGGGPAAAEQLDRRLAAALRLQARRGATTSRRRRGVNRAMRIDTGSWTRCATSPPDPSAGRRCRSTTRTPTSRSATSRAPRW